MGFLALMGVGTATGGGGPPATTYYILAETGEVLNCENDDKLRTEQS